METKSKSRRKTLQELTIMDGFLFGAVMMDPENCRGLLERILDIPISRVNVIKEKSLIYHPEYRGIRMDVFADDEAGTKYDIEVQIRNTAVLKRSRYYHSHMDMETLLSGVGYENLPDSYVIFICDYDPFDKGKYRYTINSSCKECWDMEIQDGVHTIILNNKGTNPEEVPEDLVTFLDFTRKSLEESEEDSEDSYIKSIQDTIRQIKSSREMGEKYMTLQEMLKEEREEGRKEGREEGCRFIIFDMVRSGDISASLGAEKLSWSLEDFQTKMEAYFEEQQEIL